MNRNDEADDRALEGVTREHIARREERLTADAVRDRAGTVGIRRDVVEEPRELDVTVRHDEVHVERRPADRPLANDEQPVTAQGDSTVVLVIEERLEVRKVPWVVEEIHVRRRLVSEQRRVAGTVRKEQVRIEAEGDIEINEHT